MREHPLLMKGPLVRATLEGRKTQTRRPVKMPSHGIEPYSPGYVYGTLWNYSFTEVIARCPLGRAGDRLWVRETWDWRDWQSGADGTIRIAYAADGAQVARVAQPDWNPTIYNTEHWRPSIHMPRWASRITLPLVSVRVERVQSISEADAIAEGVEPVLMRGIGSYPEWMRPTMREVGGHQKAFELLWKQIYGDALWDANPWVWVAEWKEIEVSR